MKCFMLFEMFYVRGVCSNCFREGGTKLRHFLSVFFFGRINLKQTEKQNGSTGVQGDAYPENC